MTDKKSPPQDEISSQLHQLIILDCDELMEGIGRNIEAMARSGTDTVKTIVMTGRPMNNSEKLMIWRRIARPSLDLSLNREKQSEPCRRG